MYKYPILLYGFASRTLIELRRYPLNFLGTLATYLMVFGLVFVGGRTIAPEGFESNVDAIIVGYFLLTTVLATFYTLSGLINTEAKYGTLQQLYVAPFPFPVVMLASVLANLVVSIVISVVTLGFILVMTGESLTIDLVTIVPVLGLTILHAIGVGFLLGGVALVYKRIRGMFSMLQFAFIGIISMALTDEFWPRLLPVGQGAAMLHEAMANGRGLLEFSLLDHAILASTTVVYVLIGYLSFHLAQHHARRRGLLDDY
ncbi:ABC transporter permease [Halorussus salinus]|uniref:ABC transporter permease n=1 Tax=Halorussus salinus TaxID=1364935 RepID=UPI0010931E97|nr:ABC transporter permease [Halorussus salinus]